MSVNSSSENNKILRIWAVSDNKPGHQNQVEGLINAVSNYRKVEVKRISATTTPKSIWMLLRGQCKGYSGSPPHLVIGAGHQTHFNVLALRRCFGGKAVIMMSPSLPLFLFDMCFIPRHDFPVNRDNVVETLGAINRVTHSKIRYPASGLILIGGPSRHFEWDSESVVKQIQLLLKSSSQVEWVIAGSRRTPFSCYKAIKSQLPAVKLILPEDVSPEWLPTKIQETEQIWVTEDSISMIYEALTSGAKTGLLRLGREKSNRITKEVDRLIGESSVSYILPSGNVIITEKVPSIIDEADRCARLLLKNFSL
jgi:hypothetical protein